MRREEYNLCVVLIIFGEIRASETKRKGVTMQEGEFGVKDWEKVSEKGCVYKE